MDTDSAAELTCHELVRLVTDYLEGALPPAEAERFAAHLSECEGCQLHLAQMRRTIELLGSLSEETISKEACADLLTVFRRWRQAPT